MAVDMAAPRKLAQYLMWKIYQAAFETCGSEIKMFVFYVNLMDWNYTWKT